MLCAAPSLSSSTADRERIIPLSLLLSLFLNTNTRRNMVLMEHTNLAAQEVPSPFRAFADHLSSISAGGFVATAVLHDRAQQTARGNALLVERQTHASQQNSNSTVLHCDGIGSLYRLEASNGPKPEFWSDAYDACGSPLRAGNSVVALIICMGKNTRTHQKNRTTLTNTPSSVPVCDNVWCNWALHELRVERNCRTVLLW